MEEYRSLNFYSLCKPYYWQKVSFVSEGPILAPEFIFSVVLGIEYVLVRIIWLSVSQSVDWTHTVRNLPGTEEKLGSENTKCTCEIDLSPYKSYITITSWKRLYLS